jgi:hypothetical protein
VSYSLKVEWSNLRITEVYGALGMALAPEQRYTRGVLRSMLSEWFSAVDDSVTIKLWLTQRQLDVLETSLAAAISLLTQDMMRARDGLPGASYEDLVVSQTQVFAALQDIQSYREATRLAGLAESGD